MPPVVARASATVKDLTHREERKGVEKSGNGRDVYRGGAENVEKSYAHSHE